MKAAIQFLTVFPIRSGGPAASGAFWFPVVGALLLLAACGIQHLTHPLLALAFLMLATGGLHEDAIADIADALRAYRTPEQMHAILKDPHLGAHGGAALMVTTLMRWQGMASAGADPIVFATAGALSRASILALALVSRPATLSTGGAFVRDLPRAAALAAIALSVVIALPRGLNFALAAVAVFALTVLAARFWFHRRLGGVTGDCLGATCLVTETLILLLCPRFI